MENVKPMATASASDFRTEGAALPGARVLVVIPTLDEAKHIGTVLDALLAPSSARAGLHVVVADGGSTDGTLDIVRARAAHDERLSLLHNPDRIQSAAVNLAVARYGHRGEVLVRCDAHGAVPPHFVDRLVASLERHQADAVVVPMDAHGQTPWQKAVAWVSDSPVGSGGSAHRGGRRSGYVDHGHHAAFRMDSFRRAGGYDPEFSHNEDAELDCRQRALGARIYLDADIRFGYMPRDSIVALWRQYRAYGRGRARTVQRHPTSLKLRQLAVPLFVAASLLLLVGSPVWPALLAWHLAYVGVLLGMGVAIAVKQRAWCGLLAAPAAAAMHFAWGWGFFEGLWHHREARWSPQAVSPLSPMPADPSR